MTVLHITIQGFNVQRHKPDQSMHTYQRWITIEMLRQKFPYVSAISICNLQSATITE